MDRCGARRGNGGDRPCTSTRRVGCGSGGGTTAATIQEAIDMVALGGTVQMLPGTYHEAITITKGLTLEAAGERTGRSLS
jgi:hypothetical protein